jgi:hypothetical protein
MPSSYSTNLKIELQATGENSGTWGTVTNTNLGTALEQAIVGYGNPDYLSDANLTLTYTDTNSAQTARALVLNVTSALSLTGTRELVVPTIQKQYIVQNNTTGSQSITVKTSAGTGITIPNGRKAHLYVDGTNVIYMDDYVDINGGAIDGTPVGANSASTGAFSTLSATGNVNFDGGTFTFNDSGADKDFRVEGDTDANLLFSDASTDRIGIGTNTPASKLDVNGTITATAVNTTTLDLTNLEVTNIKAKDGTSAASIADSTGVVSFTANPILSGGTANGVLYLNGSKVATSGSALAFDGTLLKVGSPTNAPNTNLSGNLLQIKSSSGFSYLTMGNGDGANNNTYIGSASSIATFGTVTDAGVTTELMRLTSSTLYTASGINVGIGTSSPAQRLHVQDSTANNGTIQLGGASFYGTIKHNATGTGANEYVTASASGGGHQFFRGTTLQFMTDSSGNLGLGVTPSAWSVGKAIEVGAVGNSIWGNGAGNIRVLSNAYYNGAFKYATSAAASQYTQDGGTHAWSIAPSWNGTGSDVISFTQAMTLDADGDLGVGTTSPAERLHVVSGANTTQIRFTDNTNCNGYLGSRTGNLATLHTDQTLAFGTGNSTFAERARITSGGYFKASNNGTYTDSTGAYAEFYQNANDIGLLIRNQNASNTANVLEVAADRNTTNNSYYLIRANVFGVENRFQVADSGNVTNTNGSYGTISDAKMKTDIVDAGSQWDDLKAVRFRKFKMKDDPQQITQLGVVAQELEQTSPGLVEEHADRDAEGNDLGTTTKSVKSSILLMKAAVALQEAMTRIEQLEAKVATLESK